MLRTDTHDASMQESTDTATRTANTAGVDSTGIGVLDESQITGKSRMQPVSTPPAPINRACQQTISVSFSREKPNASNIA